MVDQKVNAYKDPKNGHLITHEITQASYLYTFMINMHLHTCMGIIEFGYRMHYNHFGCIKELCCIVTHEMLNGNWLASAIARGRRASFP